MLVTKMQSQIFCDIILVTKLKSQNFTHKMIVTNYQSQHFLSLLSLLSLSSLPSLPSLLSLLSQLSQLSLLSLMLYKQIGRQVQVTIQYSKCHFLTKVSDRPTNGRTDGRTDIDTSRAAQYIVYSVQHTVYFQFCHNLSLVTI